MEMPKISGKHLHFVSLPDISRKRELDHKLTDTHCEVLPSKNEHSYITEYRIFSVRNIVIHSLILGIKMLSLNRVQLFIKCARVGLNVCFYQCTLSTYKVLNTSLNKNIRTAYRLQSLEKKTRTFLCSLLYLFHSSIPCGFMH